MANINIHVKNIFLDNELDEDSTIKDFLIVQTEGSRQVKRNVQCYNLDMIIAVGYRVNSKKATKFRQWATKTLKEFIQIGFVLNDDMLKNGKSFGIDYFDELLERIKEIRASERREDAILMSMRDWLEEVDLFLKNNRRNVLDGKGHTSHESAMKKAGKKYEAFWIKQEMEYISEFDKDMEKYFKGN